jgi:hypothetical protein
VIVARPTKNDGPLKRAKVLGLTRPYSGSVSTLVRALLRAEVIRFDEPRIDEPGCAGSVRFSTALCIWLQIGTPLL